LKLKEIIEKEGIKTSAGVHPIESKPQSSQPRRRYFWDDGNQEAMASIDSEQALAIQELVGKEKKLVLIACEECQKIGSLETDFISTDILSSKLSINSNRLRNLTRRVVQKGFLHVESRQFGRVGLRKFKIQQAVYQQFRSLALASRDHSVSSAAATALAAPSSSSGINIDLNTKPLENHRQ
jgi:hypothetical protein